MKKILAIIVLILMLSVSVVFAKNKPVEYKVIVSRFSIENIEEALNAFGVDGWRLVDTFYTTAENVEAKTEAEKIVPVVVLYLEREVK